MDGNQIYYVLRSLIDEIVPAGIFVVLPLFLFKFYWQYKKNATEKRTQIVLAAIEKDGDTDIEELMRKIAPKKSLREKLTLRTHWEILFGSILTIFAVIIGIALLIFGLVGGTKGDVFAGGAIFGIPSFAIGIGLLIAYRIGKNTLEQIKDC